jgi:hypothetical protein
MLADELRANLPLSVVVSDLVTDAWTVHAPCPDALAVGPGPVTAKERRQ